MDDLCLGADDRRLKRKTRKNNNTVGVQNDDRQALGDFEILLRHGLARILESCSFPGDTGRSRLHYSVICIATARTICDSVRGSRLSPRYRLERSASHVRRIFDVDSSEISEPFSTFDGPQRMPIQAIPARASAVNTSRDVRLRVALLLSKAT